MSSLSPRARFSWTKFSNQLIRATLGLCLAGFASISLAAEPAVVDASSMNGKVMCGFQGWFNTPTDGSGRGLVHWGKMPLGDGDFTVDMLPDVSELDPDERFATAIKHKDGQPVEVFSSYNSKTVLRQFKWMQDAGIDGVFLQRFFSGLGKPPVMKHYDQIVENVRNGAKTYGRAWGMMYDLSGMGEGKSQVLMDDWKKLSTQDHITQDKQYIHHNGKPLVVLWGIGFGGNGKRPNLYQDGLKLVNYLHDQGNTVMIGVPHQWRGMIEKQDENGKALEKVCLAADIIQPWAVGSAKDLAEVTRNAQNKWAPDKAWCEAHGRTYMPVVFPGFTWHNLRKGTTPSDQIPRLGGRFLWQQYVEAKKLNMTTVYQAMFDEVDEGTAIFKVTSDTPTPGKAVFVGLEGLPSDFYLRLVGEGTKLIRGEITADEESLIGKYTVKK